MKLLFRIKEGTEHDKSVIGDTDFRAHYPDIDAKVNWPLYKPHIENAIRMHVIPYIGQDLYDALVAKYAANDVPLKDVISRLQDAIAWYAELEALPTSNIRHSAMGIQQSVSSESTSQPANQWRYKNALWQIAITAGRIMDDVLMMLEKLKENETIKTLWIQKDVYSLSVDSYFGSTAELSKSIGINESRRTYLAMIPFINKAVLRYIVPIICDAQQAELITQIKSGEISANNLKLINKIKPCLANYALMIAIPAIRLVIHGHAINVVTTTDTMTAKDKAEETAIQGLLYRCRDDAETFRADLIDFLYENVDDYPLWKTSKCYDDSSECACPITSDDMTGGIFL